MNTAKDIVELMKPRITTLVVFTTASGLWLAPGKLKFSLVFLSIVGSVLLVSAANALNMYIERDVDRLMARTQDRPLPAKRLAPPVALWFGISLATIALALLFFGVNTLTGILGVIAFVSYVLFYTPMKQQSHVALLIGAVPGAIPPLMGWTSATGSIGFPGLVLFLILFFWQIPHFLAIALLHQEEYQKAGIRVMPLERGETETKHMILRYLAGLYAVTLYPAWYRMTGPLYFWAALVFGAAFFIWGCYGLRPHAGIRWARSFFLASILYLPLLLAILVFNAKVR